MKPIPLLFASFSLAVLVMACAPESRMVTGGAGGSGGKAGAGGGGRGGTGGSAGSGGAGAGGLAGTGGMAGLGGAGGMAGMATGGTAGMATGGMAGMATGGMAGMATAGMGGAGMGGMAGMTPPPPPGPIAPADAAAFYPGTAAGPSKVVTGDAAAGYFYTFSPSGITPVIKGEMLTGADLTGLPAGVTWAQRETTMSTSSALILFGWNFRPDDGMAFRWIDASAYAGFTFWAKATGQTDLTVTTVDAENIATTDARKGACTTEQAMCKAVGGLATKLTTTWTKYKFRWADFKQDAMAVQGPVDTKQLARIDLLYVVPDMGNVDFFITGIQLAKEADLQ